jgi:hypothetical protein
MDEFMYNPCPELTDTFERLFPRCSYVPKCFDSIFQIKVKEGDEKECTGWTGGITPPDKCFLCLSYVMDIEMRTAKQAGDLVSGLYDYGQDVGALWANPSIKGVDEVISYGSVSLLITIPEDLKALGILKVLYPQDGNSAPSYVLTLVYQ